MICLPRSRDRQRRGSSSAAGGQCGSRGRGRSTTSTVAVALAIAIAVGLADRAATAPPLRLQINGRWRLTIDDTSLVLPQTAGSDLIDTYTTTGTDNTTVRVQNTASDTQPWQLEISRLDTNWPAGVSLLAKRVTDGTGPGSIAGGTDFLPITAADQVFFNGVGDRSAIEVQLQIEGVSVTTVGVDTYTTTIYYTVTET